MLATLSAPAGTGKTSLLATWVARLDRPVAWLALDERDQEVHQVLRYLVASLQTITPECGRTALALLDAPPTAPPEVVLTSLLNDLADLPTPALLVLDDYHLVRAPAVHAAIEFFLNHLPPTLHLAIATREDPPLPLPRMRASGQMIEIRVADLSFNVEEAAAFLSAGMGLRLTERQVAALVERTEGWAAGLQLAGLALRDRTDPAAFVEAFTGGHRLLVDYLMAEVLERQPVPVRRFLLVTSVLDRLCAPLCDALLARDPDSAGAPPPAINSQQVLEGLEAANLSLVPLDDERMWYRYHHLFADALRGRLGRETGRGAVALLHRKASVWFGRQGLLPEAVDHALAGDAVDDAARWLEALSADVTTTDWLDAIPTDRPAVIVADGLMGFLTGDEMISLLNRLISHVPSGEVVFNSYPPFAIWAVHHSPGTKSVSDLIKFPGFTDPREPESWNPKLKLVKEILLSREPEIAQFPGVLRTYCRLQSHSTAWSRKGTIILHYRF